MRGGQPWCRAGGESGARRVDVRTDLGPAAVDGDPGLVDRVVESLVDNATVHNVDDGWMRVHTRTADGWAEIEVANGGRSLAADGLYRLFEAVQRGVPPCSPRRTGVGLSIVRSVVEGHRGAVATEALDGGGLRVVARFPAG